MTTHQTCAAHGLGFLRSFSWILPGLILSFPVAVEAQFDFTNNNGAITITKYTGSGGVVVIPGTTNGLPVTTIGKGAFSSSFGLTSVTIPDSVTTIGDSAFQYCYNLSLVKIGNNVATIGVLAFDHCDLGLTNITIPASVTNLGHYAFSYCLHLTAAYFQGNTPSAGFPAFYSDSKATLYYLPGTTNWGSSFGSRPTALWQPLVQTADDSFGVRTTQFGFNISWASGMVVVVEASTDVANPTWSSLRTNTLTDGPFYFSDSQWTNYPTRYYRLRWP